MANRELSCIILAAGQGTRMRSARSKVLHCVGGKPMLAHAVSAAQALMPDEIIVVTAPDGETVAIEAAPAKHAVQPLACGTGDAVQQGLTVSTQHNSDVLVLYGDTPLVRPETLTSLRAALAHDRFAVAVLGFEPQDPGAYGRLVVGDEGLEAIVESADATEQQRTIGLCNAGMMAIRGDVVRTLVSAITNNNPKGEYYLTDVVALARAQGHACTVVTTEDPNEALGVNDRTELAVAEGVFQTRMRQAAMRAGVTLISPETVFFAADTRLGADVIIEPHVVFGAGVDLASGTRVRSFSHLEGVVTTGAAMIGPYARLRPGTRIAADAHIGNFVEIKNAAIGAGAKANHLSYIGDAAVGAGANIGAGTITCNYDGVSKHHTEIGADVFVGSNSALVAPVRIGEGAIIGAGSTITNDVEADAIALNRAPQTARARSAARLRARLKAKKVAASATTKK